MAFEMPTLPARSVNATLRNVWVTGGSSLSGREQRVYRDAGFWEIKLDGVLIRRAADAWAYDAMLARLRTGEAMIVPLCRLYKPAFSYPFAAYLTAAVAVRQSVVNVTVAEETLVAGQKFSIGDRLHQIIEVVSVTARPGGLARPASGSHAWSDADFWRDEAFNDHALRIIPPIRQVAAAEAAVEFSDLRATVVLAAADGGDVSLDLSRFGSASLTLVEQF